MLFRTLVTGILLAAGAFAQLSSFPKPTYFRETFQSAQTKVELKDPVKLKDFVAGGKLELSLKHYLDAGDGQQHRDTASVVDAGDAEERDPAGVCHLGSAGHRQFLEPAFDYAFHQLAATARSR